MVRKFSPMELLRPKSLMETISIHFDPDNPRYKFCCESVRATYGAVLVGILELLGAVTFFCQVMIENRTSIMAVSCSIVVLGTTLILVGFLFYGVKFGKAHFVFPHLVFQVFEIVSFLVASIVLVFALLDRITADEAEENKVAGFVAIICCFFAAAFEIWFLLIVLSCYRYLRDKAISEIVNV